MSSAADAQMARAFDATFGMRIATCAVGQIDGALSASLLSSLEEFEKRALKVKTNIEHASPNPWKLTTCPNRRASLTSASPLAHRPSPVFRAYSRYGRLNM